MRLLCLQIYELLLNVCARIELILLLGMVSMSSRRSFDDIGKGRTDCLIDAIFVMELIIISTMTHQERLKYQILRLANQSANSEVRVQLVTFLNRIKEADEDSFASRIADTLLGNLRRFKRTTCSDKQAFIIACCAYKHCLDIDREGNCFDYFTPFCGNL